MNKIVADVVTTITEEIAGLNLMNSFPSVASILVGATADYLNTISGGLKEYAGGAFSYLLSNIMSTIEDNIPDKIFDLLGNMSNGLLAIADVLLNAKTEIILAAAYYTALELRDKLIEYNKKIDEIISLMSELKNKMTTIDAPIQYKEIVKKDILASIGALETTDKTIDKIINSPGSIKTSDVEILRNQFNSVKTLLCDRPFDDPIKVFPELNDIFNNKWSDIWNNFKNNFVECYQLLQKFVRAIIDLELISVKIDLLVGTLLEIDLDSINQQPFYTSYKKAMLIKIKQLKLDLEKQIVNSDPTNSLFLWPGWCTEILSIQTLYNTAFPEKDQILNTIYEAKAKYYQIKEAQKNLKKCNDLAINTFKSRLISFKFYAGYAFSNGVNDIQRGFINNIYYKTSAEGQRLKNNSYCIMSAIQPILHPPYESTLFVALKTIFESLGADIGLDMLNKGQIDQLKTAIAKWSATGGLSLTLAGTMIDCITPLINSSNVTFEELQSITNLLETGLKQARSLKINIPIPQLNLPINLDPSEYLKYKNKLQNQIDILNKTRNLLNGLASKIANDLYSCT